MMKLWSWLGLTTVVLVGLAPAAWAQSPNRPVELGCLSGDGGRYHGNRALSRYEFAAALANCMEQLEQLIPSEPTGYATQADLEQVRQRQEALNAEIRQLHQRLDEQWGDEALPADPATPPAIR